jgi:hypothetical protein
MKTVATFVNVNLVQKESAACTVNTDSKKTPVAVTFVSVNHVLKQIALWTVRMA